MIQTKKEIVQQIIFCISKKHDEWELFFCFLLNDKISYAQQHMTNDT